jgi:integrase
MIERRPGKLGLGRCPKVTLSDARREARKVRTQIDEGHNPFALKAASKAAKGAVKAKGKTLLECADAYVEATRKSGAKGKPWSAAHSHQWHSTFHETKNGGNVYPALTAPLNDMPIASITKAEVLALIEPLWQRTPTTAARVKARLEAVFGWAIFRELRAEPNPAAWKREAAGLPTVGEAANLKAMPYREVAKFMAELRSTEGTAAKALEFLILTATRASEAFGAKWAEIDLEANVWVIPASRMKAGKQHTVPLTDAAIALLRSLQGVDDEFVFWGAGRGAVSIQSVRNLLNQMRPDGETLHGFRSSFSDWAHDGGLNNHAIELSLAHAVGNAVERSYRRGEMLEIRRNIMAAWASYCGGGKSDTPAH